MVKQEFLNRDDRRQQALDVLMESRSKLEDETREMSREMDELKERLLRVQEEKRLLEEEKRIMGEREKRGEEKREKLMEELRKKEEEVRVLERERGRSSEEMNESLRGRLKELEKELEALKSSDGVEAKKFKKEDKNDGESFEELRRKIRGFQQEKEKYQSGLKTMKERCEKLKMGLAKQKEGEKEKVKELEEKVEELKEEIKVLEKAKDEAERGLGVCKNKIREVKQENKEKCDKLMEDLRKQEEGERERTRILADRIRDLESGKGAAESELEFWKVKFREFDSRVLHVQEDIKLLLTIAESMPEEDLHKANGFSGMCACENGGNVNYNQGNAVCSSEHAPAQEAVERKPGVSEKKSRKEYKSGNKEEAAGSDNCSSSANVFQINESKHVEQVPKLEVGAFTENCFVEKELDLKPDVIHISDDDDHDEIPLVHSADEVRPTHKRKRSISSIDTVEEDSSSESEDTNDMSMFDIDPNLHKKWSRWEKEQDMVLQFETDQRLCMRAVCVLYREEIFQSASGSDAIRGLALAYFLTDGNTDGRMRKKIEDLKAKDEKGVDDCRRIAMSFSKQLFEIHENKPYPFFYVS